MKSRIRFALVWTFSILALLPAAVSPGGAQVVRQLTDHKTSLTSFPALDAAGTKVWATANTNQFGGNPAYVFHVARWDAATGAGALVTSFPKGIGNNFFYTDLSVSDDGAWLAFISSRDLTGQNHDQSHEVFVMQSDGTQLAQVTNDPSPTAGSVYWLALSGNGGKIVFQANTDPLGNNPGHLYQLFSVNRDGTGLTKLTSITHEGITIYLFDVSDDGQRVVFSVNEDLTPGNADRSFEIFAVASDGTGLRQLTSVAGSTFGSIYPTISGNGAKVVFQSNDNLAGGNLLHMFEVFAVNWDGTGMRQLTTSSTSASDPRSAEEPDISDDGVNVVFGSDKTAGATNADGNMEVWKIRSDGTGLAALTNTTDVPGVRAARISGGGTRVAAYVEATFGSNPSARLVSMTSTGTGLQTLAEGRVVDIRTPDLTSDGTRAVFASRGDFTGANPDGSLEIFRIDSDATALAQVTSFTGADALTPSIAADRSRIAFASTADPVGGNPDHSQEIFLIRADGTGLTQLTFAPGGTVYETPAIAANGSIVVYAKSFGGGVFRVATNGTGSVQLSTTGSAPRVDDTGTSVAFQRGNDVFCIHSDGTGLTPMSSGTGTASAPDISGNGLRVTYISNKDPLATNPDRLPQVFAYETIGGSTRQLTFFHDPVSLGRLLYQRLSGDGAYVYLVTNQEVFEDDPDYPYDLYRLQVDSAGIERAAGLHLFDNGTPQFQSFDAPAVDYTGGRAAFASYGDWTDQNPDYEPELWLVDRPALPGIRMSGRAPTTVSWDVESGPIRYDVVRGDLANLQVMGDTVDLGPVVCLENDSPDATTSGFADVQDPPSHGGFFYLYRGSQGEEAGPGSFGWSSLDEERVAGSGVCAP